MLEWQAQVDISWGSLVMGRNKPDAPTIFLTQHLMGLWLVVQNPPHDKYRLDQVYNCYFLNVKYKNIHMFIIFIFKGFLWKKKVLLNLSSTGRIKFAGKDYAPSELQPSFWSKRRFIPLLHKLVLNRFPPRLLYFLYPFGSDLVVVWISVKPSWLILDVISN